MSPTKEHMFLDIVPELNPTSKTLYDKHFLKEFIHSVNIFKCVLGASHVLGNIVIKTEMLSDLMGFIV